MTLPVRILLVLAILPILHPPRVCCCWLVSVAPRPEPTQATLPAPVKKCRCCAARSTAHDTVRADLPRNTPERPPHRSDCPVVAGVDQTWHTETQSPILDLLLEQGTFSSAAAFPPSIATVAALRFWSSGPPTYLKQCTLRC